MNQSYHPTPSRVLEVHDWFINKMQYPESVVCHNFDAIFRYAVTYTKQEEPYLRLVSRDLQRSMVTKQITFDQRDSESIPAFKSLMDCCGQALVSKLEILDTITST